MAKTKTENNEWTVILFYKFYKIKNPEKFKAQQRKIAEFFNLKGRMLIAKEGVNATFEGKVKDIKNYIKELKKSIIFKNVVFKESKGNGKAFTKLQVKLRPEMITLGIGDINVKKETAKNITAEELEKLYKNDEDFKILDLRNIFEIEVGKFDKTVDPGLVNFRDLPKKIKELKNLKEEKIITVCTGQVRCEKATCLLKKEGFKNVYQLKDGIHTYIKKYPGKHFKGSLFVFDNRMTTPVVDIEDREVIGECFSCGVKCEDFYNDDSTRPSTKIICCKKCAKKHKNLRNCTPAI